MRASVHEFDAGVYCLYNGLLLHQECAIPFIEKKSSAVTLSFNLAVEIY